MALPRPRLRHDRRFGLLFHPNQTPNLYTLFFALSLALLPPLLTSPFLSQGVGFGLHRLPEISLSISQPKTLCSKARGYLSELHQPTYMEESQLSFCSPFSTVEFLAAASNLSSSTTTGPDKVAYTMLKHLPCSGMDFLLHIFNLSWTLHSFPSIWKASSIIPIHKKGKPLNSPASFRPISLTDCILQLFECIILSRLLFFLESNSILSSARPVSAMDGLLYIKFFTFLSPSYMSLTNPGRALRLLTPSGTQPFSINLFGLAFLLALLVGLNLSFLA